MSFHAHQSRLYELFDGIEREFRALWMENLTLRNKLREQGKSDERQGVSLASHVSPGEQQRKRTLRTNVDELTSKWRGAMAKRTQKDEDWRVCRGFLGHRDGVWEVTASISEEVLGSASLDRTVRIFAGDSFQPLGVYVGHKGSVNSVRFHPSQRLICTASGDQTAHVWKNTTDTSVLSPVASTGTGTSLRRGRQVLTQDATPGIEAEECGDGGPSSEATVATIRSPLVQLKGHTGVVAAAEWLSSGEYIVTASWDRTARVWALSRGDDRSADTFNGHEGRLTNVDAHPKLPMFLTSSRDATFRLWDTRVASFLVGTFPGHADTVTTAIFTVGGTHVVTGSDDRTVKVWDMKSMKSPVVSINCEAAVNRLSVARGCLAVAAPLDNARIKVFTVGGEKTATFSSLGHGGHTRMVTSTWWSRDETTLYTSSMDGSVLAWKPTGAV
eukprot:TRINITY_DN30518_c0_g1_i1.p1 TRINITY_DN30518_c0_g1~~TRINITY_DN30518_c0_g1_i1.p1  ORF type:complete len:443 (+),score=58.17 TRINITY_DN30518_c0_g1_i1:31-1359(+)